MRAATRSRIWRWGASAAAVVAALGVLRTMPVPLLAQSFVSGSTGADGAYSPACTTCTVDVPPSGVLNYTTVNIGSGTLVTFNRNVSNTPVTILATGDVTIAGSIDVSGASAVGGVPGRGGPGGFDGGVGGAGFGSSPDGTPGGGPGGGLGGVANVGTLPGSASGAGYGTAGAGNGAAVPGGQTYGVQSLFPLVGGSGGGGAAGGPNSSGPAGGGGGGAIVIASSGTITMNVAFVVRGIYARGGNGVSKAVGLAQNTLSGCGSGGSIRLVANTIVTNGAQLDVRSGCSGAIGGGFGRIRLEAYSIQGNFGAVGGPPTLSQGLPGPVVPGPASPSIRIVSIGGVNVPPSPQASYFNPPDVNVNPATPNPIPVVLQGTNVPPGTAVNLSVITEGIATRASFTSGPLSGTPASSTATANVTLPPGTSILTATATFAQ
jgi:hypothetical protein